MKIVQSMETFLEEISGKNSARTVEKYHMVLDLFKDYLLGYGEISYNEAKNGELFLTADTEELEFGHAGSFLDWFLIRKVMGPQWIMKAAPNIIKRYFKWLDAEGLLSEGVIEEVLETAKDAARDLPRVEKASSLIYALCSRNAESFESGRYKYDDENNFIEGYGEVTGIIEDNIYLDYEGEKIGPIQVTGAIVKYLKKGDTMNLVVRKKGKKWYPVESGNIYPA